MWFDIIDSSLLLSSNDSLGFLHLIILAGSVVFPFADRHIHEPGGHVRSCHTDPDTQQG